MRRPERPKTHRKGVVTHTLIVGAFLLFLLFLAEPLFDRLERIPGEAQLQQLELPAETGGIQYWIDQVEVTTQVLSISGWAFINGHDSVDSEIHIVLRSTDATYVFTTRSAVREDVTAHFEELGLELDYSGFSALLPLRRIAGGDYTIGIYIKKGDIEALQYIDKVMVKSKGSVEIIG